MIQRLWLVVSIAWTALFLLGAYGRIGTTPLDWSFWAMLLLPWITGPLLWHVGRWVMTGR
jgi:hypothetical protein